MQDANNWLIVGLGKSGLSAARFLAAQGERFSAVDSREQPPGLDEFRARHPDADVILGPFDPARLRGADTLVLSPGVAMAEPAVQAALDCGVEVLGDVELFAREISRPVVAITGSNGKSTVTTLVGEMARRAGVRAAVAGNIGAPVLDLLTDLRETGEPEPDLYVLELSSFQLETTHSLAPAAAVVLNVSPDHMDRYESLNAYAAAKGRIYSEARLRVINRDDPVAAALTDCGPCVSFGLDVPGQGQYGLRETDAEMWLALGERGLIRESELRIRGRHNTANALAALALGAAVGLDESAMLEALRAFPGLPHRTQWVARIGGVDWYNDSKGTNVGATLAALSGMPGKVVLLAGGLGKGQDFSVLREAVAQKARAVIVFGTDAPLLHAALRDVAPVESVADLAEAVMRAGALAHDGDSVLLSPACASFDQFTGYEQRGERFADMVRGMAA